MREIKFRAYCKKRKAIFDVTWMLFNQSDVVLQVLPDTNALVSIKNIELMQYTGFKDKNGREIYEGDIIRIYNDEINEEDSWIDEVSYHMGGFFSGDEDLLGNVHFRAKVIGNIYENPELLENASTR